MLDVEQGGEYSKSTIDIIEKILAAGIIGDNGKPNEQFDPHAEALVLLSLMQGDDAKEARVLVEEKVKALKQMDQERLARDLGNYSFAADSESRDISEDFLFHVMSSEPKIENGGVILEPVYASMSTHGTHKQSIIPRDSIHFSFGGPVGAHEGGDWNNKGYIVITKADPTVLKPECTSIKAEDTIFEVFPSQKLRLNSSWVVGPTMNVSSIPNNSFFHLDRENNRAYYARPEDITYEQLEQLFREQQLKNFNLRSKQNIKITEANIASSLYGSVAGGRLFQGSSGEVIGFVNEMMSKIKVNFRDQKLPDAIQAAAPDLNKDQITFFLGALQQHMRDFVAREAVLAMGGSKYEPPMGEGWQDERDGLLAKYAVEHGRVSRNDFRSPEGVLQHLVASAFIKANPKHDLGIPDSPSWVNGNVERHTSEDKPGEDVFLWERFSPRITSENLLRVSSQQRATIYDAGVLNAR